RSMNSRGPGSVGGRTESSIGNIAEHKINPNEDLGSERAVSASKTTGSAPPSTGTQKGQTGPSAAAMASMAMSDIDAGGALSSNRGGGAGTNHYCDEKKEWKTWGFSLEVVMDHRRVPDLLVALSNAEGWPINILRVNVADASDGDLVNSTGGSAGDMSTRSMMPTGMRGSGAGPTAIPTQGISG